MLEQVNHDADRVTRLITELLDISRLESGRLVLRRAAGRPGPAGGEPWWTRCASNTRSSRPQTLLSRRLPQGVRRPRQGRAGARPTWWRTRASTPPRRAAHRGRRRRRPGRVGGGDRPGRRDPASGPAEGLHQVLPPRRRPPTGSGLGPVDQPGPGRVARRPAGRRIKSSGTGRRFGLPFPSSTWTDCRNRERPQHLPPPPDRGHRRLARGRRSRRPWPASEAARTWRPPRRRARRARQAVASWPGCTPGSASSTPDQRREVGALDQRRPRPPARASRDLRRGRGGSERTAGPGPRPSGSTSPSSSAGPRRPPSAGLRAGPRPPQPGDPDPERAGGHLRRHGLRRGRGPRGRDRLVQLRGAQHAARPTRPGACGTPCTCGSGRPRRCCCGPTPHRCRSG